MIFSASKRGDRDGSGTAVVYTNGRNSIETKMKTIELLTSKSGILTFIMGCISLQN